MTYSGSNRILCQFFMVISVRLQFVPSLYFTLRHHFVLDKDWGCSSSVGNITKTLKALSLNPTTKKTVKEPLLLIFYLKEQRETSVWQHPMGKDASLVEELRILLEKQWCEEAFMYESTLFACKGHIKVAFFA